MHSYILQTLLKSTCTHTPMNTRLGRTQLIIKEVYLGDEGDDQVDDYDAGQHYVEGSGPLVHIGRNLIHSHACASCVRGRERGRGRMRCV